jgi:hypothetical protein
VRLFTNYPPIIPPIIPPKRVPKPGHIAEPIHAPNHEMLADANVPTTFETNLTPDLIKNCLAVIAFLLNLLYKHPTSIIKTDPVIIHDVGDIPD